MATASAAEPNTSETSVSHSREKISLCCEIILDHFGAVAAQVACTLLQRGRLTLRELSRFLATATLHAPTGYVPEQDDAAQADAGQLLDAWSVAALGSGGAGGVAASTSATSWSTPLRSQRLIQQALITLIQHNLCWHARPLPDGTLVQATAADDVAGAEDVFRGTEYFQINVEDVLPRLRFGTYLALTQDHFDDVGVAVVSEILRHGKLRVSDLIERVATQYPHLPHDAIEDALRDLLYYAYVQPSLDKSHTSARDRRIAYEAELVSRERKMLGPKDKKRIAIAACDRLREDDRQVWYSSPADSRPLRRGLSVRTTAKKRGANGAVTNGRKNGKSVSAPSAAKKAKTNEGNARQTAASLLAIESSDEEENGVHGAGAPKRTKLTVDPTLFVRINFDRFDVHIRNDVIVRAVASRLNAPLASVVEVMLRFDMGSYEKVASTRDVRSCAIHISTLRQKLPPGLNLKDAFDREALRRKGGPTTDAALLGEAVAVLLGAGDQSATGKARNFIGPTADARTNIHLGGFSQVQVEYGSVARTLRQQILRNVVREQFSATGARVMALLADMGKLDEKQISKVCLMSMSETRDVCARLFAAGLLSLQEVPKSSERVAARSFFFWYVDERKCTAWLSDRLCKTLARLAQRRRHELGREADLVAKSQRVDVHEDERRLLPVERVRLQHVRDTLDMLTLAEARTWRDMFVVAHLPE